MFPKYLDDKLYGHLTSRLHFYTYDRKSLILLHTNNFQVDNSVLPLNITESSSAWQKYSVTVNVWQGSQGGGQGGNGMFIERVNAYKLCIFTLIQYVLQECYDQVLQKKSFTHFSFIHPFMHT